jgi:hypothetical protein
MALKAKRTGFGLSLRSFSGRDGTTYLVFRTKQGSFHVFGEVEAKEAARQCGASVEGNTRAMWQSVWRRGN